MLLIFYVCVCVCVCVCVYKKKKKKKKKKLIRKIISGVNLMKNINKKTANLEKKTFTAYIKKKNKKKTPQARKELKCTI